MLASYYLAAYNRSTSILYFDQAYDGLRRVLMGHVTLLYVWKQACVALVVNVEVNFAHGTGLNGSAAPLHALRVRYHLLFGNNR